MTKKTVKKVVENSKTKTYLSNEDMQKIVPPFREFEKVVNSLPDCTIKKSMLSHIKYINKNIEKRTDIAERKEVIKALRSGKINIDELKTLLKNKKE